MILYFGIERRAFMDNNYYNDNNNNYNQDNYTQDNFNSRIPSSNNELKDENPNHIYAVLSLICAIAAVATCCCCLGIIFGPLAIIFAVLSRYESFGQKKFEGKAVFGLITGIIITCLSIIYLVMLVNMFNSEEFRESYQSVSAEQAGNN